MEIHNAFAFIARKEAKLQRSGYGCIPLSASTAPRDPSTNKSIENSVSGGNIEAYGPE